MLTDQAVFLGGRNLNLLLGSGITVFVDSRPQLLADAVGEQAGAAGEENEIRAGHRISFRLFKGVMPHPEWL